MEKNMPLLLEWIRKAVVLVLLMEVVLQMQAGKQYESYLKMLIGIMVVYNLVSGILGAFQNIEATGLAPMKEFQWAGAWYNDLEEEVKGQVKQSVVPKVEVQVEVPIEVSVEKIDVGG
jgi:hypothetical protein